MWKPKLLRLKLTIWHIISQILFYKWVYLQRNTLDLIVSKYKLCQTFFQVTASCTLAVLFHFFFLNLLFSVFFFIKKNAHICRTTLRTPYRNFKSNDALFCLLQRNKSHIEINRKNNGLSVKSLTPLKSFFLHNFLSSVNKNKKIPNIYWQKNVWRISFAKTLYFDCNLHMKQTEIKCPSLRLVHPSSKHHDNELIPHSNCRSNWAPCAG